jgi:hypothetical protein
MESWDGNRMEGAAIAAARLSMPFARGRSLLGPLNQSLSFAFFAFPVSALWIILFPKLRNSLSHPGTPADPTRQAL